MEKHDMLHPQMLETLGLTPKDFNVYLFLLKLGTAPLRKTAEAAGYRRGTTYDALKRLHAAGLVSYVDARTHRYFTAEDPHKLRGLVTRKEVSLEETRQKVESVIPELRALSNTADSRPAVRYFEGDDGVYDILHDVLSVSERLPEKKYRIYSSAKLRDAIAQAWPDFTPTRVKRNIAVHAISLGPGGDVHGLDQRRWLSKTDSSSAYIFIYGNKTAYISADNEGRLFGAVIDDIRITSTQAMIFDALWGSLK